MKYTVRRGDTLSKIAAKYNTTVEALAASNGIKNPDRIDVGDALTIPTNKGKIADALINCLDAIEGLDEFRELSGLLEED